MCLKFQETPVKEKGIQYGVRASETQAPIASASTQPVAFPPPSTSTVTPLADSDIEGHDNSPSGSPTRSTPKPGTSEEPSEQQDEVTSTCRLDPCCHFYVLIYYGVFSKMTSILKLQEGASVIASQNGLEEVMRMASDRRVYWAVQAVVHGYFDGEMQPEAFVAKLQQVNKCWKTIGLGN